MRSNREKTLFQNIGAIIKLGISKRCMMLWPIAFWTGISIAYFDGVLVRTMSISLEHGDVKLDDSEIYEKAMLGMVTFGFGELIGSFLLGYIIDRFGNKISAFSNFLVMIVMFVFTFVFCYT